MIQCLLGSRYLDYVCFSLMVQLASDAAGSGGFRTVSNRVETDVKDGRRPRRGIVGEVNVERSGASEGTRQAS